VVGVVVLVMPALEILEVLVVEVVLAVKIMNKVDREIVVVTPQWKVMTEVLEFPVLATQVAVVVARPKLGATLLD
jgi:uncharacterized membrane protein